ncbi:MAG: 7-carboxy-7-deazaguanine synthase QueE [Abitibacteriaceae bacterium]|nr:7-carboxy-7-deazaguanine synthase QueE [Abditibacteriaceae bacterium]
MDKKILVNEIFGPTIQGEGALIGKPTIFVRTGSCDYRCHWCDTLYAVLPEYRHEWTPMTAEAILEEVARLSAGHPILITISGGNPALQPLEPLLDIGHQCGFTFALETQGSVARSWFAKLDHLVLSPKPPSSAMSTDWEKLAACVAAAGSQTHTVLKIVVFDEEDYAYARRVGAALPHLPIYLQIGNPTPLQSVQGTADETFFSSQQPNLCAMEQHLSWLLDRVTADGWNEVTVLPQLHVLLWGNKRGV